VSQAEATGYNALLKSLARRGYDGLGLMRLLLKAMTSETVHFGNPARLRREFRPAVAIAVAGGNLRYSLASAYG